MGDEVNILKYGRMCRHFIIVSDGFSRVLWRYVYSLGMLLVVAVGCDPVRTTSQGLQIKIIDSVSGQPVNNMSVQVKPDFGRFNVAGDAQRQQHQRQFWEGLPWSSATTDADGVATFKIIETALDRSRSENPPPSRDVVSGHSFLLIVGDNEVRAKEGEGLKIEKGAQLTEGGFTITVVGVGEPIYVETPK